MPDIGFSTLPRRFVGSRNSHENPASVTSAVPSMLISGG